MLSNARAFVICNYNTSIGILGNIGNKSCVAYHQTYVSFDGWLLDRMKSNFLLSRAGTNAFRNFTLLIYLVRDECKTKKTFQFGHCPNWGGGFTLARIFLRPFFT